MNNLPQQWSHFTFPQNIYNPQQQPQFGNFLFSQGGQFQQPYMQQQPFQLPPFHGLSDALNMISPANLQLDIEPEVRRPSIIRRFKPQKKDPVLDTDQEIKKWLEQRRLRYPTKNKAPETSTTNQELSILETRLRKKICILSGSAKRTQVKVQQMQDLCKMMTRGQKQRRENQSERKEQFQDEEDSKQFQTKLTKEEIKQEICTIQQKLKENHPKELYKQKGEGVEVQELGKGQKKRMKKKLKMLKDSLLNDREQGAKQANDYDHYTEMVKTLKQQKEQMKQLIDESLDYKHNPVNYRYKADTLLTNLLLDQIYKERQYLLQAIRYIIKENFFEEREFELISEEDA